MNPNKKNAETAASYVCETCDFKCSKKSNYDNHLLTLKHKNLTNPNDLNSKHTEKKFECHICSKVYKHASTLSAHKKICKESEHKEPDHKVSEYKEPEPINMPEISQVNSEFDLKSLTSLVINLIKSNQDLHKQVIDVCQKIQPSSTINNNTTNNNNSHNKNFNLNFFLNEQCKDAMNIMDFVNTFQLEFADLERIGEVGYVEGISNIVINKLNEMDVYKRPIHCSDAKREIMYVKDKDVWAKENASNDKIRLALKHITKKNSDMIRPWANAHPGVLSGDHRLSDKYQIMIIEAMGGNKNKTMREGEDKIIKKISKMVLIDKGLCPLNPGGSAT